MSYKFKIVPPVLYDLSLNLSDTVCLIQIERCTSLNYLELTYTPLPKATAQSSVMDVFLMIKSISGSLACCFCVVTL
jgi:hypothetical protein